MRKALAVTATLFTFGALARAQEAAGQRVVVPPSNSSQPRLVNASTLNGSISVKTHSGKDVIVEISGRGRASEPAPSGMRRIDMPPGLDITEENNQIRIRTNPPARGNMTITVPPDTSLKLNSNQGSISVEGVTGEIEAKTLNGNIGIDGVSGTVLANTLNGELKVSMTRVDPSKPMSFSTLNGNIDVSLPADTKADLKLKTDHGEIFSDFEIKLTGGGATAERNESKDGRFRIRFDRTMYGTINGGGSEISFYTLNGSINIRKK